MPAPNQPPGWPPQPDPRLHYGRPAHPGPYPPPAQPAQPGRSGPWQGQGQPPGPPGRSLPPPGNQRVWGKGPPLRPACVLCGRGPAVEVPLYRHTGVILLARTETLKKPLCRDCGLRCAGEYLGHSLIAGWWSPLSLLMNPICILGDLGARKWFRQLPQPSGRAPSRPGA